MAAAVEDNSDPFGNKDEYALSEKEATEDILPSVHRGCTDFMFFVLFVAYIVGMIGLTAIGYQTGDPNRLIQGADHLGELCGGPNRQGQKFIVYPRVEEDIFISGFLDGGANLESLSFFSICQSRCPLSNEYVCTIAGEERLQEEVAALSRTREDIANQCVNFYFGGFNPLCPAAIIHRECFQTLFDTQSVLNRCLPEYVYEVETLPESRCTKFRNITDADGNVVESVCVRYREVQRVVREQPTASNILFDSFNTYLQILEQYTGDIVKSYRVILGSGIGVTMGVGFVYIAALWCCVGVIVWFTVLACILMATIFTLYCYLKAGILSGEIIAVVANEAVDALEQVSNGIDDQDLIDVDVNQTFATSRVNASALPAAFSESVDYQRQYEIASYVFTGEFLWCSSFFFTYLTIVSLSAILKIRDHDSSSYSRLQLTGTHWQSDRGF